MSKYECVRDSDTNGGLACVAAICLQYKKHAPMVQAGGLLEYGVGNPSLGEIVDKLGVYGFQAKIIAVTKDGFRGKFKLPCIVRQLNCEGLNHFVVLHKIGWKHFLVAAPAKGLQKVRKDSFFNDLNRYAVICAPMSTLDRVREKSAFGRFFSF